MKPSAKKMLQELYDKDRVRTREHNILVQENRDLIIDRDKLLKLLGKTMRVISEYGQITDESRIGWLMVEIDRALGEHGYPAENEKLTDAGPVSTDCK